jgi:hypothetical protein
MGNVPAGYQGRFGRGQRNPSADLPISERITIAFQPAMSSEANMTLHSVRGTHEA